MLFPKHEKLSKTKSSLLLKKYGLEMEQLPLIKITDAAIKKLIDMGEEININDVIQITRNSKTAGNSSLYFRRVVL